jgi:hypothetical protein
MIDSSFSFQNSYQTSIYNFFNPIEKTHADQLSFLHPQIKEQVEMMYNQKASLLKKSYQ